MRRVVLAGLLAASAMVVSGCTISPEQTKVSPKMATGAKQASGFLWEAVSGKKWEMVNELIESNATFTLSDGRVLNKEEMLGELKAAGISEVAVGAVTERPEGKDMVLTYTATFAKPGSASSTTRQMMSVWQEMKKGSWVLVAQSETPVAASTH